MGSPPQARLVADSAAVCERALFGWPLPRPGPDTLLPADRGFPSCDQFVKTVATGVDVLWRVSASFALPVLTRLTDGACLSELRGARKKDRVTVRVVECSIRDDDGNGEVFALITNLLDPDDAPDLEPARAYSRRLHIAGVDAIAISFPPALDARQRLPLPGLSPS